jgi:cobalt-zinc-cadmium efflux system membrane fusion protein
MNTTMAPPTDSPSNSAVDHEVDHEMEQAARARLKMGWGQRGVVVLLLTVVLVPPLAGFYSYFSGIPLHLLAAKKDEDKEAPDASGPPSIVPVSGQPHTLEVSDEVAGSLGIRKGDRDSIAVAQPPTMMRPLELPGSTAIIPGRLARIKPRFASARVVQLGQVFDRSPKTGMTEFRELRPGDTVAKDDLLGVFYSVDVGSKKNDLLQALVQYALDQQILEQVEKNRQAVPLVYYLTQVRQVQGDRAEVNRALNNLKVWDIPQEEVDALRAEAKKISANQDEWSQTPEGRWVLRARQAMKGQEAHGSRETHGSQEAHGSRETHGSQEIHGSQADPGKEEEENPWGRVTLRAPFDGVVLEQNVHKGEMMSDPTVNLFQIADVSRLLVIAHCPEDALPALEALHGNQLRWTVRTVGAAEGTGLPGTIDEIGYIIDANQHTAVIKGYVDNPGKRIRAGQYVSATVSIPSPGDVVEIPDAALVDDGKQSLVFVQPDPAQLRFTMRRVQVTHRFADTVFVRSTPIPKEEQLTAPEAEEGLLPREPLRPGERVLTAGSVELKRVEIDFESRPKDLAKPADLVAKAKQRTVSDLELRREQKPRVRKG